MGTITYLYLRTANRNAPNEGTAIRLYLSTEIVANRTNLQSLSKKCTIFCAVRFAVKYLKNGAAKTKGSLRFALLTERLKKNGTDAVTNLDALLLLKKVEDSHFESP